MNIDEVHRFFVINDYTWKMDGVPQVPTEKDIETVFAHAQSILDSAEGDDVQLEVGRLLFKKRDKTIDVYVYYGEINDD